MFNLYTSSLSWVTASHVYIHTGSGVWPEARATYIYTPTGWKKTFPNFTSSFRNWTDPDGTNDGLNTTTQVGAGSTTVAAASRINMNLVPPFASEYLYYYSFDITCFNSGFASTNGSAVVDVEVAEDSQTTFTTKNTHTCTNTSPNSTATQNVVSQSFSSNATGSIIVRLKLTTTNNAAGTVIGTLKMYLNTWNTDNHTLSWS